MKVIRIFTCTAFVWLALVGLPCRGDTLAILVGGVSKDANDQTARDGTLADVRKYLLTRTKSTEVVSTAAKLQHAFDKLAAAGPQDRLVFWYVGQANATGDSLRFNLSGPDVTHEDLAARLARINVGSMLIVLDCPNAARAAKALSATGRVVVFAATQEQSYGTQFSRHFVSALLAAESDADKDGRVSILEAFAGAAKRIEQWYRDRQILPTETPCLDDNSDGTAGERPWNRAESADGTLAAKMFLDP